MTKTIGIGRGVRVVLSLDSGWTVKLRNCDWGVLLCPGLRYALDYAALHLKSPEALGVALAARLELCVPLHRMDYAALEELVREANKMWTLT